MATSSGPLTAAIDTSAASSSASTSRTRASLAATAHIAPPAGSDPISRPRVATSFSPSSRLNTPATHAATYSPTLCPITAEGSTPQLRHSSESAHSRANSAGCVYAVSSKGDVSPSFG